MLTTSPQSGKNTDIEVLRAFAILYTVILHFNALLPVNSILLSPLRYLDLSVGVDLFLVISGFVITRSLLESTQDQAATRRALMLSFWVKRIFRLLPAAWTWVLLACLAQLTILGITDAPYELNRILAGTAAALGNFMNFWVPHCLANDGGQTCLSEHFVGHYWSLSLEEQFYLVFPFLFFFLSRSALIVLLITAILAQFMWQRPFFSYAWYFKTDALCWGILLAFISQTNFYRRHPPPLLRHRSVAAAAGLVLLFLLPALAINIQGIGPAMQPYGVAVVALLCAIIVWLASYDGNLFAIGTSYRKLMLYLGSRSYALYLSHLVVYMTIRDLFNPFVAGLAATIGPTGLNTLLLITALGLSLLGAELTYRLVETALRARGRAIAGRLVAGRR